MKLFSEFSLALIVVAVIAYLFIFYSSSNILSNACNISLSISNLLSPLLGDLPQKRLERKCQQLESIVSAVLKIAKDNQVIVEFCAGGVSFL